MSFGTLPTVKIVSDNDEGFTEINACDFDNLLHVLCDGETEPAIEISETVKALVKDCEALSLRIEALSERDQRGFRAAGEAAREAAYKARREEDAMSFGMDDDEDDEDEPPTVAEPFAPPVGTTEPASPLPPQDPPAPALEAEAQPAGGWGAPPPVEPASAPEAPAVAKGAAKAK